VAAHGGELPSDRVLELEREACARADAHAAVSGLLAELVQARGARCEAEVFPCAADTERFLPDPRARAECRAEIGADDGSFVLGFAGSAAGWQRPDALLRLYKLIAERRDDPHLLVLTPDVAEFRDLLARELPLDASWSVRSVRHAGVPAWLNACDATALLRDRDAVNRVASPIKFGESLACGVPVILSRGIGDASALTASEGLGALLSGPELGRPADLHALDGFLAESAQRGAEMARRCRRVAEERWSWSEQVPRWLALHRRLAAASGVGH
jgi:glycosyltransferase involved in cell wall biosynthesis